MTIEELELQTSQQDTTTTGGAQPIKFPILWDEIERQKIEDKDPKASALLELRKEIRDEILLIKEDGKKFKKDLEDYQNSLKSVNNFLIGIVTVTSIAFISTLSLVFWDMILEKGLV